MKDLKIGQSVKVSAITEIGYYDGYKTGKRTSRRRIRKLKAVVIGRRIKYLGKTSRGYHGGYPDDYEPSVFYPEKQLELWEVRTGMLNSPLLVADEDLTPCHSFKLERMTQL